LFKIKKTVAEIVRLNGVSVETLPLILASSIALVAVYIKTLNFKMTDFYERAIGHASINGVDAPMRVRAFWICIAIFILSFLLGNFIINRTKNFLSSKFPERPFDLEKTLFFEFGVLLFINVLIYLHGFVKNTDISRKPVIPLAFAFAVVCLYALISIFRAYKNLPAETHIQSALFILYPILLTYFTLLVISSGTLVIPVISVKSAAIYIIFYFFISFLFNRKIRSCAAAYALVPLSFLPLAYITANEAQYTLMKHGIVTSSKIIALGFCVFLFGIALFVYLLKHKSSSEELALKKNRKFRNTCIACNSRYIRDPLSDNITKLRSVA